MEDINVDFFSQCFKVVVQLMQSRLDSERSEKLHMRMRKLIYMHWIFGFVGYVLGLLLGPGSKATEGPIVFVLFLY